MKSLVKTVATTAVVLTALAGCASRGSGGNGTSAAAGAGSDTSASSSAPAGQATNPSTTGATPGLPSSSGASGASGGNQSSAPGAAPGQNNGSHPGDAGQVKTTSPQGVTLAADGVTLVTEAAWGGCTDKPQLVVTSQDAAKVVVVLKTTSHYRVGIMCPNNATEGAVSVKLAAPLGSRQVIDGVKNVAISVG